LISNLYKSWYMKRIIRELETQSKGKKYVKASKCPKANCPKSVLSGKTKPEKLYKRKGPFGVHEEKSHKERRKKRVTKIKLVENVR